MNNCFLILRTLSTDKYFMDTFRRPVSLPIDTHFPKQLRPYILYGCQRTHDSFMAPAISCSGSQKTPAWTTSSSRSRLNLKTRERDKGGWADKSPQRLITRWHYVEHTYINPRAERLTHISLFSLLHYQINGQSGRQTVGKIVVYLWH